MNKKNRKRCLQSLISMLLVCMLVLPSVLPVVVRAEETEKSPSDASDYYNALINTTSTLIEADLFTPIKKVPRNTPIHLTGNVKEVEGETGVDEKGAATYGTLVYIEVELADGTIGWTSEPFVDKKKAVTEMFAKKDVYLLSKADEDATTQTVVSEGEKVAVESIQGDYSKILTDSKKEGWILSSDLVKLEPLYLYCTKQTGYYYNNSLKKDSMMGTSVRGLKGSFAVGTKLEYVHTTSRDGLKDKVYEVITPTGELAFVDATCFSFKVPDVLFIQNKTALYKDANANNKLSILSVGTKVNRLFSSGNYYKVKVGSDTGWVKKTDTTGKEVAKVKKNYGTYYLTHIEWMKEDTYPAGTTIVRVDPYYYEVSDQEKKSKVKKEPYVFIKGQYPNGKITKFTVTENGDLHKSKKKAITFQKDLTSHAKQAEQEIFKELNEYRKSKGIRELLWSEDAYKIDDSYFNYCVKIGATDFPHIGNAHGWFVSCADIIYSGPAMGINDTTKMAKRAMQAWKKSAGHDFMLLDDRYYHGGAAVAVMYNDTCKMMEVVIMCSKSKGKLDFEPRDDNYIAKTWFPFMFENPKFTNKRGDAYTGLDY